MECDEERDLRNSVNFKITQTHVIMKNLLSCIVFYIIGLPALFAQQDLNDIFKGNLADAKYLTAGYAEPLMKALGYGANQSWYNTAKTHETLGFDLSISFSPVYIPGSAKQYVVDNSQLSAVELYRYDGTPVASTAKTNVPTFAGPDKLSEYRYKSDPTITFNGPRGEDADIIPLPMLNGGIGLPLGFDLKMHLYPKSRIGNADGKFSLIGFGLMHDVKQHIPGMKELPFDVSVFAGYTHSVLDVPFDKADLSQRGKFQVSATTIQALISKKISLLTIYGGLGYNFASTQLDVKGGYDFNADGDTNDQNEVNPFSLKYNSTGPRATAGLRFKLAVIAFHIDYTLQKYNALTVGMGINFR
jgi:hypothetical protein